MTQNSLLCADVPLQNYSLTHSILFQLSPKLSLETFEDYEITQVNMENDH